MTPPTRPARRVALAGLLFAVAAVCTARGDVVILKDGFTIQGTVRKEQEVVFDGPGKKLVAINKAAGFDMVDEGPKVWVFSTHARQLGQISPDVKIRPPYKAYTNWIKARKGDHKLPDVGSMKSLTEFDDKWRRTLVVNLPGRNWESIEQQIVSLDPYQCEIVSNTHFWRLMLRTSEMDPAKVRKLLSVHPELVEKDGPDPLRRVAIAKFMLDAGWLQSAKQEMEQLRKVIPGPLPKDAQDQLDKLNKEMDQASAELVLKEAELALGSGRYRYAGKLLEAFPDKSADPKDVTRATTFRAQQQETMTRFETGRRLLRALLDEVGGGAVSPAVAGGGGPMGAVWPRKSLDPGSPLGTLAAAGEQVCVELHPDSVGRIEFFVNLAATAERERGAGQSASKTPVELLATVVSGWVKGKNGATPLPELALKLWAARTFILAYQRGDTENERHGLLLAYTRDAELKLGIDELTQVIALLPPAQPDDPSTRVPLPSRPGGGVPPGVFLRKTPFNAEHNAIEYSVKLPPEYHPGRAYPVVIALAHPGMDPGQMIGALSHEADRNGYILLAPDWSEAFKKAGGWSYQGEDHVYVTAVLRDAVRRFTVDNDRVFLLGMGYGANMAMDVGVSHPDLFAGVLAMGPAPKWQNMFMEYWHNAQKLPVYIVTGELSPGQDVLIKLFQEWMPKGFPALMVVYKGRAVEWYSAEPPVMFDWMSRKKRANGVAILRMAPDERRIEFRTMRPTDNRFYWIGADKIAPRNLVENVGPKQNVFPAGLSGNIRGNNLDLTSRGVRVLTAWLSRDMIDWTKPVDVFINNNRALGWKTRVLTPDLKVLLEDYRDRGDRRMLFLAKLGFNTPP